MKTRMKASGAWMLVGLRMASMHKVSLQFSCDSTASNSNPGSDGPAADWGYIFWHCQQEWHTRQHATGEFLSAFTRLLTVVLYRSQTRMFL